MSVLPTGRPLQRFLPDLDDLLYDPAAYLRAGVVAIGPRRMYGLAALFGIPGIAFLLAFFWLDKADPELVALGIGLLLGASVWLGWSLLLRGHELVLHPEGVEVRYRDTTVWCPWALFNSEGRAYVPEADSPLVGLTPPIAAEAVPFVELRRQETPIAHGGQVKSRQFLYSSAHEVVLPARYEVVADDLGELLLQLGRRLGRQLPKGTPPIEAYQAADVAEGQPESADPDGWFTVHLTRLSWPPRCCSCGATTSATMRCELQGRWDWVLGIFIQTARVLQLGVPVCETCQQEIRRRQQRGGMWGMRLGGALLAGVVVVYGLVENDFGGLGILILGAAAAGAIAGFIMGTWLATRLPVAFRNYSPARGTVSMRFREPEHASWFMEALRAVERIKR
jgi:hypothetical protein